VIAITDFEIKHTPVLTGRSPPTLLPLRAVVLSAQHLSRLPAARRATVARFPCWRLTGDCAHR
jgi:hypothetical protein